MIEFKHWKNPNCHFYLRGEARPEEMHKAGSRPGTYFWQACFKESQRRHPTEDKGWYDERVGQQHPSSGRRSITVDPLRSCIGGAPRVLYPHWGWAQFMDERPS
jgi:hypothetical protein